MCWTPRDRVFLCTGSGDGEEGLGSSRDKYDAPECEDGEGGGGSFGDKYAGLLGIESFYDAQGCEDSEEGGGQGER